MGLGVPFNDKPGPANRVQPIFLVPSKRIIAKVDVIGHLHIRFGTFQSGISAIDKFSGIPLTAIRAWKTHAKGFL